MGDYEKGVVRMMRGGGYLDREGERKKGFI